MAGRGRRFSFHGAYKRKADAKKKEKSVGGFVRAVMLCRKRKCHRRYVVLKKRGQ